MGMLDRPLRNDGKRCLVGGGPRSVAKPIAKPIAKHIAKPATKPPRPQELPPDTLSPDLFAHYPLRFPTESATNLWLMEMAHADATDLPIHPRPCVTELPPRPHTVCAMCWEQVVAEHFGLWSSQVVEIKDSTGRTSWTGGLAYTRTEAELSVCYGSGCRWGTFILDSIADRYAPTSRNTCRIPALFHVRVGTPSSSRSGRAMEMIVVVNDCNRLVHRIFAHADDPAMAWVGDPLNYPYVGAPETLAMAAACVEECVQEHERCRAFSLLTEPPSLPTRLIDCSDPLRPRIVDTTDYDAKSRYIALSYVWGEDQPHRTTHKNLPAYRKAIDLSLLPQTIRDAIHVCHALGIYLLWADCLCIIQDSREDKHRELVRMRTVYLHAFLTIDAGNAKSVSQGFLRDGGPPSLCLPFICPQSPDEDVLQLGSIYLVDEPRSEDPVSAPLFTWLGPSEYGYTGQRAWCLQETLMSRRNLLFTDKALQLRCRSGTQDVHGLCDYRLPFLRQWTIPDSTPDIIFRRSTSPQSLSSDNWLTIHQAWHKTVQDYTARSLSYASDKLVACAGLAEVFGGALGSDYLAGLWRDSLLHDLLWFKMSSDGYVPGTEYVAPSWSWAAGGGPICYSLHSLNRKLEEDLADVVECTVTLEDSALPFGPVTDGSLTLLAPLLGPYKLCVELTSHEGEGRRAPVLVPTADYAELGGTQQSGRDDANIVLDRQNHRHLPDLKLQNLELKTDHHYADDEEIPNAWLVPLVYRGRQRKSRPPYKTYTQCLVVAAVEPEPCGNPAVEGKAMLYRRIASCSIPTTTTDKSCNRQIVEELRSKVNGQWTFPRKVVRIC
ncbi:HET-domain-containing protein [Cubamyces sp. BRFM 1775]|nr:HET-domain-containing protein [Cubamyces sp. BRFM 1775]